MSDTGQPVATLQLKEPPVSKEAGMQGGMSGPATTALPHTSHAQPQAHVLRMDLRGRRARA